MSAQKLHSASRVPNFFLVESQYFWELEPNKFFQISSQPHSGKKLCVRERKKKGKRRNNSKQAGAELCQAHVKLGLARNCVRFPLI